MTGWQTVELREVAKIDRTGLAPADIADGSLYVGLEHIESGGRLADVKPVQNGALASTKFRFTSQHILFGKLRPYLAKIALPNFDGICSTDILPILPGPQIDRRYLTYYLRQPSMVNYAESRSEGANLPRLSPKALAEFEIPLPPLAEQKRIAAILDQADALCRLRQRAIDRLDNLGEAIFHEIFGDFTSPNHHWPTTPLRDLVNSARIGIVRAASEFSPDLPVEYLRMDSIEAGGVLRLSGLKKTRASENEIQHFGLVEGDFLFNTRNSRELVGKTAVVRNRFFGIFNNNILRIRFNEKCFSGFLDFYLRTPLGRSSLEEIKSGTTSVVAIYQKNLMELMVPNPPSSKLRIFDKNMNALQSEKERIELARRKTESLFFAIQHRAFRGEL